MAIIAICRGTKSGGTELAECLGRGLEYPIVGEEVVRDAASHLGVSVEGLEKKLSGRPTLWEPFSTMRRTYLLALQAALAERVVEGDGRLIYHGLGGGALLRDLPASLSVRCIAPMERRVCAVMRGTEMEPAEAERYIRELDQARVRWVKAIYGHDVADPSLYDVVVNLDGMPIDGVCGMIARMIRQPEYEITDAVRQGLENFRTACRVKRALVEDEELRGYALDAEAEDGRVVITGEAPLRSSGAMGNRMTELARSVPGVRDVRLKVEWFDPYP
ncbi:MAG: cytidylate kinase family protein [Gemmatimonadota bacterium]